MVSRTDKENRMNKEGLQAPHAVCNGDNFFTLLCGYFTFSSWLQRPLFLISSHADHLSVM